MENNKQQIIEKWDELTEDMLEKHNLRMATSRNSANFDKITEEWRKSVKDLYDYERQFEEVIKPHKKEIDKKINQEYIRKCEDIEESNKRRARTKFGYKEIQWVKPKRFLIKGFGVTIWKLSGFYVPSVNIWFGGLRHIGIDSFRHGFGIGIYFAPLLILEICLSGKIDLHYKKGLFRIKVFKFEFVY